MEKGYAYVWLQLLLLALVFEKGYSIKCYMCTTLNDANCYDPIASKMAPTECTTDLTSTTLQRFRTMFAGFSDLTNFFRNTVPGGSFTCIKVDTVLANANGNSTIIRGCQLEKAPADDICKTLSAKAHGQSLLKFCEICNSEACNGANPIKHSSVLASMLLPILGTFLYLRV